MRCVPIGFRAITDVAHDATDTDVWQIRPVLFQSIPIARSMAQMPSGTCHQLALRAILSHLCYLSGSWGTVSVANKAVLNLPIDFRCDATCGTSLPAVFCAVHTQLPRRRVCRRLTLMNAEARDNPQDSSAHRRDTDSEACPRTSPPWPVSGQWSRLVGRPKASKRAVSGPTTKHGHQ